MGSVIPLASSEVVEEWQTRFEDLYNSAQKMDVFARGRPGTTTGVSIDRRCR
jgi:hypothetical protein